MAISDYLLTSLSVLCSSAGDGGLVCSASIITLHLYSVHPTGGFLAVGDGVFSIEGLELGSSTVSNPSSHLEELHQQYVLPHWSQNSQYLPRNLHSCSTSPSSFMWGIVAAYVGSVKTWGGYPNPSPAGTSVSDALSLVYLFVIWQGVFLFLVLALLLPSAFSHTQYLSVLVWVSWTKVNFPHVVLTFTSTSRAAEGILQNRNPSRSQVVFNDLLDAILKLKYASINVIYVFPFNV